jgi:hypothetical protein
MSDKTSGQKWTKPVLKRLGKLKDVAGAETPKAQGSGNKKS